tara:strand:- start:319 stop:762 length:444 start_codon:yes stop_codon:yes gene_type:complete
MALWKFSNLNKYGNLRSRILYRPDNTAFGINPRGLGPFISVSRFKYVSRATFNPALVDIGGKRYMVPDWIEVIPETTLNDISKAEPETRGRTKGKTKNIIVKTPSSSSDEIYTTTYYPNSEKYYCDCPGTWRTKGNCKHVKKMKNGK